MKKINHLLTKTKLREIGEELISMAIRLEENETIGLLCESVKVKKSEDNFDVKNIEINIKLSLIDTNNKLEIT